MDSKMGRDVEKGHDLLMEIIAGNSCWWLGCWYWVRQVRHSCSHRYLIILLQVYMRNMTGHNKKTRTAKTLRNDFPSPSLSHSTFSYNLIALLYRPFTAQASSSSIKMR
jgi:hypothetical protein